MGWLTLPVSMSGSGFPSHLFNLIFTLILILLFSEELLQSHKAVQENKVEIAS